MKNQCRSKCAITRERKIYAKYSICTIMMYESHPRTGCMWRITTKTTKKETHFCQFSLTQKLCVKDNDTFIFINKLEMFQTRHFVLFLAIEISHTLLFYQLASNCCTNLNIYFFSFIFFYLFLYYAQTLISLCAAASCRLLCCCSAFLCLLAPSLALCHLLVVSTPLLLLLCKLCKQMFLTTIYQYGLQVIYMLLW